MESALLKLILVLTASHQVTCGSSDVVRSHTCSFEPPGGTCGWSMSAPYFGDHIGISSASSSPALGPATDVNPGTHAGHYVFFYTNSSIISSEIVLAFPSHQYVCGLSFSYFAAGPLILEVVRFDAGIDTVYNSMDSYTNDSIWKVALYHYNTTVINDASSSLQMYFDVSGSELGEAEQDMADIFLALDNVTLTFCLPCDFDGLVELGSIIIGGPQDIQVQLRQLVILQFNASSPACPNETLMFTIEAVVPQMSSPIFSLNSSTGELFVDGSGPHLDANGTSGFLNVSVYVINSNYAQTQTSHKEIATIHFTQLPTITHTAPSAILVDITSSFVYELVATSILGQNLFFGPVVALPNELAHDINITVFPHNTGAHVIGQISLDRTLPSIVMKQITPSISIPLSDTSGGIVFATTQLLINPSPPLFEHPYYSFDLIENTSRGMFLGPVRTIDPNRNSDQLLPTILANSHGAHQLFTISPSPATHESIPAFSSYSIVVLFQFDYELIQEIDFEIVAVDSADTSLSSMATVRVNILPVNEFAPVFVTSSLEISISEEQPVHSLVGVVQAEDRDRGPDGLIDYAITDGNFDSYFMISSIKFGEVVVRRTPINPHTYFLTITASDRGLISRSSNTTIAVHVIATNDVDCAAVDFGLPRVTSPTPSHLVLSVASNMTIQCSYNANPAVRGYKWKWNMLPLLVGQVNPRYIITEDSLTVNSLNNMDGGLYFCNVTNQCGSSILLFLVTIIDYPNAPLNVWVTEGPAERTLELAWDIPKHAGVPIGGYLSRPVSSYVIQGKDIRGGGYTDLALISDMAITRARLTALRPGTEYHLRIVAVNLAGHTPSEAITVTTNSSIPSIAYLTASALQNNSILVEWEMEYDGGHLITVFEVHVLLHSPRNEATMPSHADLVYHVNPWTGRLVTRPVTAGYTYTARATATNLLGPSEDKLHNVFVGYTTISTCDFEGGVCIWDVIKGKVLRGSDTSAPLPSVDASGSDKGYFVYGQVPAISGSETVIASLSRAGYACDLTFYYHIIGVAGARLELRSLSGHIIWSSPANVGVGRWKIVALPESSHYFTPRVDDTVEFVLVSTGANASVALDDIDVNFCLPCNFDNLHSSSALRLSFTNYSRVYLRTPQSIQVEVDVQECPNVVLNFSIIRVIPNVISSSFSISSEDGRNLTLTVAAISSSSVEPNSIGYLELLVSIMNSDYKSAGLIGVSATLEFLLVLVPENCSFASACGFEGEGECERWRLGQQARLVQSPQPNINSHTGSYLYATSTGAEVLLTSTIIKDNFCKVSFSFSISPSAELTVHVDGLGLIWSSIEAPLVAGWSEQTIHIESPDVKIMENRSLSFVAKVGSSPSLYITALDNVTLHPCIDCTKPVCTLTSCLSGHYYSLDHGSCLACPTGYYCPDWRISPKPCPVGTYSNRLNAQSIATCLFCPPESFSIQRGSSACLACPAGYDCSNASGIPVSISSAACPTITTATSTNCSTHEKVIGLAIGLGCCCLLCAFMTVISICYLKRKQRGQKKMKIKGLGANTSSDNLEMNLILMKHRKHLKGNENLEESSVHTVTSVLRYGSDANHLAEERSGMKLTELHVHKKDEQDFCTMFKNIDNEGQEEDHDEILQPTD